MDVFKYADGHITRLLKEGKVGTANWDRSVFQKLKIYIDRNTLPVGNFTTQVLEDLKVIRAAINKIYDEYNLDQSKNPFRNLKITSHESERVYLTETEVTKIIEREISCGKILFVFGVKVHRNIHIII